MTVAELIEKLEKMEPTLLVATYDGGEFGDLRWPAFDAVRLKMSFDDPMRVWDNDDPEGRPAVIL